MVQVQGCRVPTADACKKTVQRRNVLLSSVRDFASGGDSTMQLAAEIQSLTKSEREDLLQQARLPIVIPADHALAMKADLQIPWSKLRILRR